MDAVLIGEAVMRAQVPEAKVRGYPRQRRDPRARPLVPAWSYLGLRGLPTGWGAGPPLGRQRPEPLSLPLDSAVAGSFVVVAIGLGALEGRLGQRRRPARATSAGDRLPRPTLSTTDGSSKGLRSADLRARRRWRSPIQAWIPKRDHGSGFVFDDESPILTTHTFEGAERHHRRDRR